jgi:hypothetical protein
MPNQAPIGVGPCAFAAPARAQQATSNAPILFLIPKI